MSSVFVSAVKLTWLGFKHNLVDVLWRYFTLLNNVSYKFVFSLFVLIVRKDPSADPRISRWIQSLLILPVQWQQRQASVEFRLHSPVCLRVSSTHNSFHSRPQMEFVVNLVSDWDRRALPNSGLSLSVLQHQTVPLLDYIQTWLQ